MALNRTTLERQLERAKQELGVWAKSLESKGVSAGSQKLDPQWRTLNARCRQIGRRLVSVTETERIDAETEARKAQNAAEAEAEAPPEPVAQEKKASKKAPAKDGAEKPKKEKKPKE